jgi:DNA-binding transcriptional ArsR family regulator
MKDLKNLSKIFKALSNPHRLELYLRIKKHDELDLSRDKKRTCFLSSLCESWKLGAPTISHHLKELVNAGLIETDKEGKHITCQLNKEVLQELREILK